jgi:acetoacetyl-CoA synthetase
MSAIEQPLWQPTAERIARSQLVQFIAFVKARFPEAEVSDYQRLHQWSITATEDFWRSIWD